MIRIRIEQKIQDHSDHGVFKEPINSLRVPLMQHGPSDPVRDPDDRKETRTK